MKRKLVTEDLPIQKRCKCKEKNYDYAYEKHIIWLVAWNLSRHEYPDLWWTFWYYLKMHAEEFPQNLQTLAEQQIHLLNLRHIEPDFNHYFNRLMLWDIYEREKKRAQREGENMPEYELVKGRYIIHCRDLGVDEPICYIIERRESRLKHTAIGKIWMEPKSFINSPFPDKLETILNIKYRDQPKWVISLHLSNKGARKYVQQLTEGKIQLAGAW